MIATAQKTYLRGDRQIWVIYFLFVLISIVVVNSSVSNLAYRQTGGNTFILLYRHLTHLIIGAFFVFGLQFVSYKKLRTLFKYLLWITPLLMIYTLFKGKNVGEASRWINLAGFSFQTSDLMKLVLIVNLASMLANKQHIKKDEYTLKALNNIIFWCAIYAGLLIFSGFSSVVLLLGTCLLLMLAGRVPVRHLRRLVFYTSLLVLALVGASILAARNNVKFARSETVVHRIEAFINTDLDNDKIIGGEIGKNKDQRDYALAAIVNGGITGTGPGNSFNKYKLPFVYSDFIYTIIVEEYGLIGGITIIALYLWLLSRGVSNIDNTDRPFGGLLIVGLTISIVFQAFMHIIVCVGLGPVTGQTLPMISLGGSSIVMTSIAIGILLSITNADKNTPIFIQKKFMR